jgi:hypothetical protein
MFPFTPFPTKSSPFLRNSQTKPLAKDASASFYEQLKTHANNRSQGINQFNTKWMMPWLHKT